MPFLICILFFYFMGGCTTTFAVEQSSLLLYSDSAPKFSIWIDIFPNIYGSLSTLTYQKELREEEAGTKKERKNIRILQIVKIWQYMHYRVSLQTLLSCSKIKITRVGETKEEKAQQRRETRRMIFFPQTRFR